MYAGVCAVCVLVELIRRKSAGKDAPPSDTGGYGVPLLSSWCIPPAVFAVSAAAVFFSFHGDRRAALQVESCAREKRWSRVLKAAETIREGSVSTMINTSRALYHTNMLLDAMFCGYQKKDLDMIPRPGLDYDAYMTLSDLFFELGHVSYAEKWAHEALETRGDRPAIPGQFARRLASSDGWPGSSGARLRKPSPWGPLRGTPTTHRESCSILVPCQLRQGRNNDVASARTTGDPFTSLTGADPQIVTTVTPNEKGALLLRRLPFRAKQLAFRAEHQPYEQSEGPLQEHHNQRHQAPRFASRLRILVCENHAP